MVSRGTAHDRDHADLRPLDLGALNSAALLIFAFSFTKPKTRRRWRTFGAFSAFIMALFVEYGFPLHHLPAVGNDSQAGITRST